MSNILMGGGQKSFQRAYLGSNKIYDKKDENDLAEYRSMLTYPTILTQLTIGDGPQNTFIALDAPKLKLDFSNIRGIYVVSVIGAGQQTSGTYQKLISVDDLKSATPVKMSDSSYQNKDVINIDQYHYNVIGVVKDNLGNKSLVCGFFWRNSSVTLYAV